LIIADTNLLMYLLVEGDQTELARQCAVRDPFWQSPAIWRHEFLNAISLHVRVRGLAAGDALKALSAADQIVETITLRGLDNRIIELASTQAVSSYDAEFLVAAEINATRVVTADQRLIDRSNGVAVSLSDFAAGK
jgi:predicted nucleic acid-binding protein